MSDGKFATRTDVTSRFEGTIPSGRLAWVDTTIEDVESELMYQVPSLRKPLDEINSESAAAGDPGRTGRVKLLVARKVLDLYRNPDGGLNQLARTTPDVTVSRAWSPDPTRGRIEFTESELAKVRLVKPKQKFGTIRVDPGWPVRP
ncbi:hypothetical protein [Mycobacterium asiaticum]|uniref:Head-to-tail adaptor n=1 Tax=Mycobacterium asiaticum TaxID=1790 RepID=A0A1A3MX31_MYCAS|nr:hypothetical protein [Mycobacterium asiaticum]OBK14086.1 hypothetical protein A5635_10350 [Mycobacterium asiaticum]